MADVTVIARPVTEGTRQALVLTEDRLGHYPEFRAFFLRAFDLDHVGLSEPGFVRAPSGTAYVLAFIGRSGEPFPSGWRSTRSSTRWNRWTTRWSTRTCGRSSAGRSAAWVRRGRWGTFARPAGSIASPRRDDPIRFERPRGYHMKPSGTPLEPSPARDAFAKGGMIS